MPTPPNKGSRSQILELAIKGRTAAAIARDLELDYDGVRLAMRQPAFRAEVAEARAEIIEATKAELHATASLAVAQIKGVLTQRVRGAGASAVVKAAEAVLDRIGLTRAATAEAARQPEAERLVHVLISVIARHPEVNAEAMAAIEAQVIEVQ